MSLYTTGCGAGAGPGRIPQIRHRPAPGRHLPGQSRVDAGAGEMRVYPRGSP